ncbi:uncharacterized protein RHOBADRAFT_44600 [Rhodotorula graminis WP1]|uniref:Uncharacterized protein n=1 Tax=Rhodotorula graminis (strain WP1) TaxID=578459 RepID=A0A194S3I5_RHOGW|nr:uncharacterized protein RHOBADRAFT_44600 [Rhodotorula graminis WP1]KPV75084.1 hypothetical protein RHOBADRAFT_44600 [Rhodotorula graminis WP1]
MLVVSVAAACVLLKPGAFSSGFATTTAVVSTQPPTTRPSSTATAVTSVTGGSSVVESSPGASSGTSSSSPTASFSAPASSSSDVDDNFDGENALKALGISSFLGNNTGGIASWYHTDSSKDSTNGRSWCEFPYDDSVPGFAPSLKTMLSSFAGHAQAAKTGFCGLWADVYSPKTGTTTKLMIADAFDDAWVLTPASIDVIYDSFADLFGSTTDDKKDVVKDVSWTLTGERDDRFTYKGVGVG